MDQLKKNNIFFERKNWITSDPMAQAWVNDLIWKILALPQEGLSEPISHQVLADAFKLGLQVIEHNELHGFAELAYGDKLMSTLGQGFYNALKAARDMTQVLTQEMHWFIGPKIGEKLIALGGYAMQPYYRNIAQEQKNPRLLNSLYLWTPTMTVREELITLLKQGGYEELQARDGYCFQKTTLGVSHKIRFKSALWESSKNWSSDVERSVWDYAVASEIPNVQRLDCTGQLIITCREFAIDSLLGSAVQLLDLYQLIYQSGESIDWTRVHGIVSAFSKPDWFWASIYALQEFEQRTGKKLTLPQWVREGVQKLADSFWATFVHSRLFWSSPEARLGEFLRAYVKLAQGT